MSALVLLFIIKIFVSIFTLVIPNLTFSAQRMSRLMGVEIEKVLLFRLYGAAVTALLVGYSSGLIDALNSLFPTGIVLMGIVSNGGGALIMAFSDSSKRAWAAIIFFGGVSILLGLTLIFPYQALAPLFTL